jgi:hypothetical protein
LDFYSVAATAGEGEYANQYGDDTSCNGMEKISIKRDNLIKKLGDNEVEILLRLHWWSSRGDGNFILSATSTKSTYQNIFNIISHNQNAYDNEAFDYIGKIVYNPVKDSFRFEK